MNSINVCLPHSIFESDPRLRILIQFRPNTPTPTDRVLIDYLVIFDYMVITIGLGG